MAEGMFITNCGLLSLNPDNVQFFERNAVAFNVVDDMKGDTARGDYSRNLPGVVRPMLDWDTVANSGHGPS
jgi:lipopolysaccharide transport system ATP-binding protein